MTFDKWGEALFILVLLVTLFNVFGCPIWLSEFFVHFLASILPHHSKLRKQEWLACLDELSTTREKAMYAVSLLPAVIFLVMSNLDKVIIHGMSYIKSSWNSYIDKAYIGNRPLVTDYSSVRVYDIPIVLKDNIDS